VKSDGRLAHEIEFSRRIAFRLETAEDFGETKMADIPPTQNRFHTLRVHATGLGVFTILSLFWLWPLPLHLTSRLPGEHDIWLFLWNFWWVKKSLLELATSPFWTDWAFHPPGVSLLYHALTPLNSLLAIPFGSGILAYNTLFIASFALSGYATYLIAHHVTGKISPAILAGYVYAFSPFHWSHLHHLEHLSIQWTAFWFLALLRLKERRTTGRAFAAGIAFALVFYVNTYLGLFSVILGAIWMTFDLVASRRVEGFRPVLRSYGLVTSVGGFLTAPVIVAMARQIGDPGLFKVPLWIKSAQSLDLLALITPGRLNPLLGEWHPLMPLYDRFTAGEPTGYLGLSVIALAALGALRHPDSRRRIFLALAGIFVLLSLGPVLHVAGRAEFGGFFLPLPQAVLQDLPAIGSARVPARYLSVAMLFVALLAGMGYEALRAFGARHGDPARHGRLGKGMTVLAAALVVVEYATGAIQTTEPRRPEYCAAIAEDPTDVAVMDLPLRISRDPKEWWRAADPANDFGWLQTLHGKRSLTGPISHTALNRRNFLFFLESRSLKPLVSEEADTGGWPDRKAALAELARLRIRYFVLHREFYRRMGRAALERDQNYLASHLGLGRWIETDGTIVYAAPGAPPGFGQLVK
jgi:drug/metabolite transporter superfamily protein YnfA